MTDLSGPPEPILCETEEGDDAIKIVEPRESHNPTANPSPWRTVALGTLVCSRCGQEYPNRFQNGEMDEPHECKGCDRQGPFHHAGGYDDTDLTAAKKARKMWYPPGAPSDEGQAELWDEVLDYINKHWDASEAELYHGLTAYALSTWLRENLTFVPHLMLMGKTTGGKTRLLNTLARVSYRAIVTASATPASMFRLIDGYNVSYYISEYHGLGSQARQQLDNVIRAGQKRGEIVTRAEQTTHGYEPEIFDPFTNVAVATQYTPDDDIVNRCIQIRSSPANRDMPATHDEETAKNLRSRLLYARYRLLESDEWDEAERKAYAYLEERDIDGRTREKLLGLVTVAYLWDRVDHLSPFVDVVVQQDKQAAADSEDAIVVEAIRECAFDEVGDTTVIGDADPFGAVQIPYDDVVERFEQITGQEKSNSWLGHVTSRLGLDTDRKGDGTVIDDPALGEKLQQLCDEHNLDFDRLDTHSVVRELPPDEQSRGPGGCEECGRDHTRTHKRTSDGALLCSQCATEERRHA